MGGAVTAPYAAADAVMDDTTAYSAGEETDYVFWGGSSPQYILVFGYGVFFAIDVYVVLS